MKKIQAYFKDYESYHRTRGNKVTHYFGITFIVISLLGLLSQWVIGPSAILGNPLLRVDGGTILLVIGSVWYLALDWKIAIPFMMVMTGFYFLGSALPFSLNWMLFAVGWIFQGIGHYVYEKKSPAFFKNFTHLLIGPLWIFCRTVGYQSK